MYRETMPTKFGEVEVGDGLPTHLIAEIGLNHNGSEELAKEMVRQAALSGATFVKFQKRSPSELATQEFLNAPFEKAPNLGRTQRQVRERLELSLDTFKRLQDYAESLGLVFFASAFDLPSLDFLLEVGVSIIKLASHSVTNKPLIDRIAQLKLPVICSLGGTTELERDWLVEKLRNNPKVLLHCVSAYPTLDQWVALDTITALREKYKVPVGFSSHEVGIDISVAASVLGASMIERHFTLDRSMFGLDQSISLDPSEFGEMAKRIRRIQKARGISHTLTDAEKVVKNAYHVAVCTNCNVASGTVITPDMLCCKQPLRDPNQYFTGLELDDVVGKVALQNLEADTTIPRKSIGTL